MTCALKEKCGGCPLRHLGEAAYRREKCARFEKTLSAVHQSNIKTGEPVFISDGTRRRASLAFCRQKGKLLMGFNAASSNEIIDITSCSLLTPELNSVLNPLRRLLEDICKIPYTEKKGRKIISKNIEKGDVWLYSADNGIDVVLEYDAPLELAHRMEIFEQAQNWHNVIRISHRRKVFSISEPILEKVRPVVNIAGYDVFVPGASFLQPSKEGEGALASLVLKYLGETRGKIADLFCGVGTFSYHLASLVGNQVLAADSSEDLLKGFKATADKYMINNIKTMARNLFKYPLDEDELRGFDVIVFDPPRAGAAAQVKKIAAMPIAESPSKIIAVSCNPQTFVNDANTLLSAGYSLEEVTLVDQFVYSNHSELVALFTKG